METAKTFHYRWRDWLQEDPVIRAKLVAHEMHRGMRESYNCEQRMKTDDKKVKASAPAPWDEIQKRFFSPPK